MPMALHSVGDIIELRADGELCLDGAVEALRSARPTLPPAGSVRVLIDDRGSDFAPSSEELRQLARHFAELFPSERTSVALAVSNGLHYGLGRILGVLAGEHGPRIRIFRCPLEARKWLLTDSQAEGARVSAPPLSLPRHHLAH